MDNQRQLVRVDVRDILQIKPLKEVGHVAANSRDLSLMGICFSSKVQWKKGQVLLIDYFLSKDADAVQLKAVVVWSELIDSRQGYFCGCEIIYVQEDKQDKFANYYFSRLREKLL
jgi:c-di-GMP-binding flagellar brake protein YcgR